MYSILTNLVGLTEELRDLRNELSNQHHDFGFGIYPHELASIADSGVGSMLVPHRRRQRYTPYSGALKKKGSKKNQVADLTVGKDGFQVCMDVQNFKPNELTVKTVDNAVVVEGKHEEREDNHGYISRHFVRKYTLPAGYDSKDVVSTLSSDGVLTVKAPPPAKALPTNERIVQIHETGPAHLSIKEISNENEENGKMET